MIFKSPEIQICKERKIKFQSFILEWKIKIRKKGGFNFKFNFWKIQKEGGGDSSCHNQLKLLI